MENERALNAADRYLMWKLRSKAANIVEDRMPDNQTWYWRYKEPPTIIEPSAGDVSECAMVETSSLGELESKGMLWRGAVAELTHDQFYRGYGWGFTKKGLRTLKEIQQSDEPEQWRRAKEFWREMFAA